MTTAQRHEIGPITRATRAEERLLELLDIIESHDCTDSPDEIETIWDAAERIRGEL